MHRNFSPPGKLFPPGLGGIGKCGMPCEEPACADINGIHAAKGGNWPVLER